MPRITVYPAYSAPPAMVVPVIADVPEKCTALVIKRLAGHDITSWLYIRLPRHKTDDKCPCYSCENKEMWPRPAWVRKGEHVVTWHRWVRTDIGARNVRLSIKGGEHFVVVALVDMPQFAAELSQRGIHGQMMALDWYTQKGAA